MRALEFEETAGWDLAEREARWLEKASKMLFLVWIFIIFKVAASWLGKTYANGSCGVTGTRKSRTEKCNKRSLQN